MTSGYILGFDCGEKNIGVAVAQTITMTARPLTNLKAHKWQPNWSDIDNILTTWHPQHIVIGLPLNMDGTEQETTESARFFGNELASRYPIAVSFTDERLTTWDAKQRLGTSKNKKLSAKEIDDINQEAAQIILSQWLEENGHLFTS